MMNVFIYNGPGTSSISVKCALNSISTILSPFFDIKCANSEFLNDELWETHCRCIVIPGGADSHYVNHLNSDTLQRIRKWIINGGIYIGICAGAYFASSSIEFEKNNVELKICEDRELALFEGLAVGSVFPNFDYDSERGSHAAIFVDEDSRNLVGYFNGGCSFKYNEGKSNFVTLGKYKEADMLPAIVYGFMGKGKVLLTGIHIEYAEEDPSLVNCLTAEVHERIKNGGSTHFFAQCLRKLFDIPTISMQAPLLSTEWYYFDIKDDNFNADINGNITPNIFDLPVTLIKSQVHNHPHFQNFNVELFSRTILMNQPNCILGRYMVYAETVTSTQDILTKCDQLSSILRHGTILIATNQTKGKGRGSNKWVSAPGCLQFTMIYDVEWESYSLPLFQYIVSISIIQTIYMRASSTADFKIKWPNDIYCRDKKVGGILINSESLGKKTRLYIGIGLNIDHVPFAGSINQVINEDGRHLSITKGEFLARLCINLDKLLNDWQNTGNFPFDIYYDMWMHSHQKIWIESEQAEYEIMGIDNDGFLVASRDAVYTKLHPNANSLDLLHGLITKK